MRRGHRPINRRCVRYACPQTGLPGPYGFAGQCIPHGEAVGPDLSRAAPIYRPNGNNLLKPIIGSLASSFYEFKNSIAARASTSTPTDMASSSILKRGW